MDRRQRIGFRRGLGGRQPGLQLIAEAGQFLQIRGMREVSTQARFVVGELPLRDVQVTLGLLPFSLISSDGTLYRVQHRQRSTVLPREIAEPCDRALDADLWGAVRRHHHTERQAAIRAQTEAAMLRNGHGQ
jgi:hypothetical protein